MFLDRIKELCEERKISIAKLEKETGIANGTIGKWKGASPNIGTLLKICKVLHCRIEDIITDEIYDHSGVC